MGNTVGSQDSNDAWKVRQKRYVKMQMYSTPIGGKREERMGKSIMAIYQSQALAPVHVPPSADAPK